MTLLLSEEVERRDTQHRARYEELYAYIEAQERAEYDEQFGPIFRQQHPYKADGARLHAEVVQRMIHE